MKAKVYLPGAVEVDHWAAQDCMTLDGLPYIGRYASSTAQCYVITGFQKWGMTGAMTAAQLITDQIIGQENPASVWFRLSRCMLHPQLFRNLGETTLHFLWPTKKRCTHLGCALHWNAAERTWDCACHGSRFDTDGTVLENPSTKPLPE